MVRFGLILLACCLVGVCYAEKARFDNYVVYRVVPNTQEQLTALKQLQEYPDGLSFWTDVSVIGKESDVMIPPHKKPAFKQFLVNFNIQNRVFIDNVQTYIDNENPSTGQKALSWTEYHPIEHIHGWLDELAATYSEVEVIVAGQTYEGRELKGVKVSYGTGKPGVFIEAGIHAREWITPATTTFILNELLTSTDPAVRNIAEAYDWYIVPSVNPDGYEFTHTNNRLWRKTRSPNAGSTCIGTDANRNFPTEFWGEAPGASSNPCDETYGGSAAFSEIEMRTYGEYLTSIADKLDVYVNFHSYGQVVLIPYGHTNDPIPNYDLLKTMGDKSVAALAQRYGTKYTVGHVIDEMYACNGLSMDWVYGSLNVPIAYSYELRDKGVYGFLLPAAQIIPTGLETLDAVVSLLEDALVTLAKK